MIRGINSRIHRCFLKPQYPTFLLVSVTERCNCRCKMCHIWRKKDVRDISLQDYRKIFSDPLWKELKILSLTGGEPFLRNDLKDIMLSAAEIFPRLERISMPTNGVLSDRTARVVKETLEQLPKNIDVKVGVSLDGPEELHDEMRGVPGGFQKALRTVEQLSEICDENFEVGILSLIMPENVSLLKEAHRIFRQYTDKITYTLITESEFFGNEAEESPLYSGEDIQKILDFINHILIPQYPEKAYIYAKYRDHLIMKRRTYPCLAGFRSAYLDPEGNLLPCHYAGKKFAMGNFFEEKQSLEKSWFSSQALKVRKKLENNPYCRSCSNNCDTRNIVQEDFWNFFGFLITHPSIPVKALMRNNKNNRG